MNKVNQDPRQKARARIEEMQKKCPARDPRGATIPSLLRAEEERREKERPEEERRKRFVLAHRTSSKGPLAVRADIDRKITLEDLAIREAVSDAFAKGDSARALELDPDFALAYAWLSRVQLYLYYFGAGTDEDLASAKAASDRAIALDPDLPEAHYALGLYYYWGFLDYDSALDHYNRARQLNPNDGTVYHLMAIVYRRKGEWDQALSSHKTAVELSPRDANINGESGSSYWFLRDYERALALYDRAIAIEPSSSFFYSWRVIGCLDHGRVEEAWRTIEEMRDRTGRRFPGIVGVLSRPIMRVFHERFREELHDLSTQSYLLSKAQSYQLADDVETGRAYYDSARIAVEAAIREHPGWDERDDVHTSLGVAYAGLGRKGALVYYGSETRRRPLSQTIQLVEVDVTTENFILSLLVGPQVIARGGHIRPYLNVGLGFSYFATESSVSGSSDVEDLASTTNFDDFTFAYGSGGGIWIRLSTRVFLDISGRYLRNDRVRYLREGSIMEAPDGSISFTPIESETNLLLLQIGVSVRTGAEEDDHTGPGAV